MSPAALPGVGFAAHPGHGRPLVINQTSRYALRILGFLAKHPQQRIPGSEIAHATGIPANYLSKILGQLRKRGLVSAEKGWGGGFVLREDARALHIAEILKIFEGEEGFQRDECVFGLPECDPEHPCPLHDHWERVKTGFHEMVSKTTVGDLAGD